MTSAKKPAKRDHRGDDFRPNLGALGNGPVHLVRTDAGVAYFQPAAPPGAASRLSEGQAERLRQVQLIGDEIAALQASLDDAVLDARAAGVSWSLIAWSVGLSGEGARLRWSQ